MDGVHDMGGMHGFGAVVTAGSDLTHTESWEVRAQMVGLAAGVVSRAALEKLDPGEYLTSSYYARWLLASERGALLKGAVDEDDLARWRAIFTNDPEATVPVITGTDIEARRSTLSTTPVPQPVSASDFDTGDRVRVRRLRPPRHHRCPRYLRGVTGIVETVVGNELVPGEPRRDQVFETFYTVRFDSTDIWGPTDEPPFEVCVDLWQRYLEPA